MPKQKLLIGAGIVILVLAAVGAYFVFGKTKTASPQAETATSQTQEESSLKGSIKSLLSGGKNQQCTIKYPDNQGEGTVYVSGNKFRGDFSINSEGKVFESHMIQDGEYMYSWSPELAQGTKIKISEIEKVQASPSSAQADLNQEVDLKCSSWGVDNSKFTPPSNVTFTDMTQTLKQIPKAGESQKVPSSACDSITDPQAKAACLQYAQ